MDPFIIQPRPDVVFPVRTIPPKRPEGLKPLEYINPNNSWFGQVKQFFWKRPQYILTKDYIVYIPSLEKYLWIPTNFVYDGASTPRFLPLNPLGLLLIESLPHDFIYRFGCMLVSDGLGAPFVCVPATRKKADDIFIELNRRHSKLVVIGSLAHFFVSIVGTLTYKARNINSVDWSKPVFKDGRNDFSGPELSTSG